MSARTVSWLAWGLWALSMMLTAWGFVFGILNRGTTAETMEGQWLLGIGFLLLFLSFATVGALIASRQPGNPIGWIFCLFGLVGLLVGAGEQYAFYALRTRPDSLPGGEAMAWLAGWAGGATLIALIAFVLLLFPNGRLLSPRWRPVVWVNLVALVFLFLWAFAPGQINTVDFSVDNPFGIERAKAALVFVGNAGFFMTVAATAGGVAAVVVRFRRARGDERQQLKWFAFAGSLVCGAFLAGPVIWSIPALGRLWEVIFLLAVGSLPVATGIAILRYRLYDIDLLINRTLVYGLLTGVLGAGYFGGVILLQLLSRPLTGGSGLAVALTTLLVAALFQPARRRVQDAVDRRFNRRRYDAAKTIEAFSARLRQETDLDTLTEELLAVVRETMEPVHVSLWLRAPTGGEARRVGASRRAAVSAVEAVG